VTGLSNRRELIRAIEDWARDPRREGVLFLLDLDHFKKVNDLYGHAAGDRLLRIFAGKLTEIVPATACCARLGGDEFAILLQGPIDNGEVRRLAQKVVDSLAEPIQLEETAAHISASIGISRLSASCRRPDALLRHADIAMYEAKRLGRNCFVFFEDEMEQQLHRRNQLEAEMRLGVSRGEFVPFYQPLINLESGGVRAFEVLARWNHPKRGLLKPDEFIEIAETSYLISTLSLSVMRQALEEAKRWPAHIGIAVNVSSSQFKDPLLAQRILQLLTETGFPPQRLELEVTEAAIVENKALALTTVASLKNSGVRIALDDFGTGYASLAQLKSMPFDRIKIDRSFVAALLEDDQSSAIVNTIANLGQSLNLPITAEGVETEAVRQQLLNIGCSDAQGWLFGEAIPADGVRQLLSPQAHQPGRAVGNG
jgi:diguanylate cyclase (GGDEF)-like protein